MERKALKDFTFLDGTFIPKGTHIAAAHSVHLDEKFYEDPLSFKPFRFVEAREGVNDASDAVNNQLTTTSLQYLLFGHGKHAWSVPHIFEYLLLEVSSHLCGCFMEWCVDFIDSPGRFFAANELKCLMGYILLNYDIKWSNRDFLEGGYAPPNEVLGPTARPDENAIIMFRRRIGLDCV